MARTEYIPVRGKVKWFRHITPDRKYEDQRWKHVMYPDTTSLDKIRELQSEGVKNVLKKDEEGYFITWSRPLEIKVRGQHQNLNPPVVTVRGADGKETPLVTELVGNGSDVTTVLEVYSHRIPGSDRKAKAARWYTSTVENLVPFEKMTDYTTDEQKMVDQLDKVPPRYF